jgi:hypothetical protein
MDARAKKHLKQNKPWTPEMLPYNQRVANQHVFFLQAFLVAAELRNQVRLILFWNTYLNQRARWCR